MKLLKDLEKKEQKLYKQFRLLVKSRIYKQNRDVMAQLDRLERIDKLEETYLHVEDDYLRQLGKLATGGPADNVFLKMGRKEAGSDEEMMDVDSGRPKKRVRK